MIGRCNKMHKNNRRDNILLIVLVVAVITLSIAYATLTQYLYINSQAVISGQNAGWRVEFTAASCSATGQAGIVHDFVMDATNLTGLSYRLNAPGDSIVCNITVTNNGTIPAKLSSFILQDGNLTYVGSGANASNDVTLVQNKIQYSIVYATGDANAGSAPATNDTLPVGVSRNLVLTATLPTTGISSLPDNDVTVSGFKTTFLYVQN